MSTQNNAKCTICGSEYYVCLSCTDVKSFMPWRTVTDTIPHYAIYMAIHGYTISKDKAKAKLELEKCDLFGLENFNPEIQRVINEIMDYEEISESNEDVKVKKTRKPTKVNS